MSVLVTGGAGYIGGHMTLGLARRRREGRRARRSVDRLRLGGPADRRELVVGDFGDSALVARLIREHEIDAIAHFAAKIVVPESVGDPLGYYRQQHRQGAKPDPSARSRAASSISSSPPPRRSMARLRPSRSPRTRRSTPISPYGRSKLMVEWMLRTRAAPIGLRYVALRYFNVAGADPQGRLGQSTPNATHLIKRGVQTALGMLPSMDIFGEDYPTRDGTCVRDYIQVTDLIDAHLAALAYLRGGRREPRLQLRLRPRRDGQGGDRRRQARLRRRFQGRPRRRGGPATRRRSSPRPSGRRSRLGWRPTRDNLDDDRPPGARLGAPPAQPAAGAQSVTSFLPAHRNIRSSHAAPNSPPRVRPGAAPQAAALVSDRVGRPSLWGFTTRR